MHLTLKKEATFPGVPLSLQNRGNDLLSKFWLLSHNGWEPVTLVGSRELRECLASMKRLVGVK
jgi:hypothetical protein